MSNIQNPQELKQILDENNSNLVLIDVRTPIEFQESHIKGATNLNVSDQNFMEEIAKLDSSKEYIVYCRSGGRSQMAQILMKQKNLNVRNCSFGMMHVDENILEIEKN